MKKFEYKTIKMLMPAEDKEIERDVEEAKKRAENAIRDGKETKIEPYFISFKKYQERLNEEGSLGWQVVSIFPGVPSAFFGSYEMNITLMREIEEPQQVFVEGRDFKKARR